MNLIVAITGATGVHAAELLIDRSPWPVTLIGSRWGKDVCRRECGGFDELAPITGADLDMGSDFGSKASGIAVPIDLR